MARLTFSGREIPSSPARWAWIFETDPFLTMEDASLQPVRWHAQGPVIMNAVRVELHGDGQQVGLCPTVAVVILDMDSSESPVHGQQEGATITATSNALLHPSFCSTSLRGL